MLIMFKIEKVNKAWAKAIYKVNLLSTNDLQLILKGLDQVSTIKRSS